VVENTGDTTQYIYNDRTEDRTVTDTKDITELTTKALTETIQADIGGPVSFVVKIPFRSPILIPTPVPINPFTT
jgi:hypothetical protein